MTDERLNFGARYSSALEWVDEQGRSADSEDLGLEVAADPDGLLQITLGNEDGRHVWVLTPQQVEDLAAFLIAHRGG